MMFDAAAWFCGTGEGSGWFETGSAVLGCGCWTTGPGAGASA
jgi:hypothetical protein